MGMRGTRLLWVAAMVWAAGCADETPQQSGIISFTATPTWGAAPLKVDLAWRLQTPVSGDLRCSIDVDRDGAFDVVVAPCPASGVASRVITAWGRHQPQLVVQDGAGNVSKRAVSVFVNRLEFQPWVVFPEQLPGIVSVAVLTDQVSLSFSGPPPTIRVGAILWGVSGEGYLRRVTSVSPQGSVVTLKTAPAFVNQAVKQGFFGVQGYTPPMLGARCLQRCQGVKVKPKENIHTTAGPELQLEVDFGSLEPQTGVKISPTLELGLQIDELALQIKPGANELRLRQSFTVKLGLRVDLEQLSAKFKAPLGQLTLGVIVLGPLVLTPMLEPTLEGELSHGPKVSLQTSTTLQLQSNLLYQGGTTKVSVTPTFHPVGDLKFDKLKVGGVVKVSAKALFSLKLFGVAGPYVAPTAYTKVDYTLGTKGICADAKAGLEVSLGLKVDPVFDKNKLSKPSVNVTVAEKDLFTRCSGGPAADAGPQLDATPVFDASSTSCDGAVCAPGATRCAGKELQTCNASGCGWSATKSCPCACVGGACSGQLCPPGATRCQLSAVETCDGCTWKVTESCICGCTGKACTSPCQ
jgi:hypothetical protein